MRPADKKRVVNQRVLLVLLALLHLSRAPAWAQQAVTALSITIVEGEGAINNVRQRVNREPIVQVEDQNHKPVAGAVVIFLLPNSGASGTFANGSNMLMTVTDNQGRAAARGIRSNDVTGQMQVRVNASFQGLTATTVITQTVAGSAAAGGTGLSVAAKWAIILGITGGAAVAGAVIATHNGGSSSSAPAPIVLNPGTPTVGGP